MKPIIRKILIIIGLGILSLLVILGIGIFFVYGKMEENYQKNADRLRLNDLIYWTGLIEEYHYKTGHYPFQQQFVGTDEIGFVRIVSAQQSQYFDPTSDRYIPQFDNNYNQRFSQFSVDALAYELQNVLEAEIKGAFDVQKVPSGFTIGYNYFVTNDGYLMWTPCKSCGVTPISTLLMDGSVASVNIASEAMVPQVHKAFTRSDMMLKPQFQAWLNAQWDKTFE